MLQKNKGNKMSRNTFVKQCKGKDLHNISKNVYNENDDLFYGSIKWDGVYIQVHKKDNIVSLFTSAGKSFSNKILKEDLGKIEGDFIIEGEYVVKGYLGDRSIADAELKSMVKNPLFEPTGKLMVFDLLHNNSSGEPFDVRILQLPKFNNGIVESVHYAPTTIQEAKKHLVSICRFGYEGLFLKKGTHMQSEGKKSNLAIKLKELKTADLVVVGITNGYLSLVDSSGITAKVKISFDMLEDIHIGMVVEIAFDFIGKAYNQARFINIRFDKVVA